MTEVRVPTLPESVTDATVLTWHKKPGQAIARDENLVDLETDKVVLEVPAPADGLIKELRSLGFLWEVIHHENLEREKYRDARVHRISGGDTMLELSVSSKLNSEWAFLVYLRDFGRATAAEWLDAHYDDIGKRSTLDLRGLFEESLRPAHLAEDAERVTKREVDS